MKRSELNRTVGLARTTQMRRGNQHIAQKSRTRISPVSEKRAAGADDRRDVRMALYQRDRGRCLLDGGVAGPCMGDWSLHHVRKSGQTGAYSLANALTLCLHHNGWVEDNPRAAHRLGLVQRSGDTLGECAERRRTAGLRR